MTTETLTLPNMVLPIGPVWAAAAREVNWLAYRLVPRAGKKPAKLPVDRSGRPTDRAQAAVLDFAAACARARELGEGHGIGYLARAGSAMVVLDLDGVVEPTTLAWREDVLPGMEDYITGESYTELSPSGTGLHVLLPREGWPEATIDNGTEPIGLHGSGALFCALTLDAVQDVGPVAPAPRLMAAVLPGLLSRLAERETERETAGERPGGGWFDELDAQAQIELVVEVLEALPPAWVVDRERWRDVTFALRGYPGLWPAWDAWSQGGGSKYDAAENELLWWGRERGENTIGIGSFLMWGEEHGVDLRRRAQSGAVNRAEGALARVAERLERIAPGAMAEVREAPPAPPRKGSQALLEEGLENVVLHEPSGRFMHLRFPNTLTSSTTATLRPQTIAHMYPGTVRPVTDEEPKPPKVWEEVVRGCHRTMQGPIADPRVPFGPAYPQLEGAQEYVVINRLRLREVDPQASQDPAHWALKAWKRALEQVFPLAVERAWVEQWIACKAQRPWERMVAVLSVTTTQGTGRGWFTDLLSSLFGPSNCANVHVEDLGGATAQWNDYLLALWVFVDEMSSAEGGGSRTSSRRRGYEMLKGIVDPRPGISRRINVKHGDAYQAVSFSSFLIASNHEDGLPIPEGDRRFSVLSGNEAEGGEPFAELVQSLKVSEEALGVIWSHLHRMDLSAFNPAKPLSTSAKAQMVDAGKKDFDIELEGLLETLGWPLLVSTVLLEKLAAARSEIGRSMHRNGTLSAEVKRWTDENSRPLSGDNVGARRLRVGGVQMRARVLKRGETGMRHAEADGLTNAQATAWLEALERDTLSGDLSQATGCRKLRGGLRVVK